MDVINQRLSVQQPIITYQDNMQISRTSLQHLRLSKLKKGKVLQGKMLDFTARGWCEANICGLEEHFKGKEVNSQQPVKDLKCQDTKIGDVY